MRSLAKAMVERRRIAKTMSLLALPFSITSQHLVVTPEDLVLRRARQHDLPSKTTRKMIRNHDLLI
jgi:hypothetical protein